MTEARSTIHLVSLGCVKNRVDSEVMLGVAEEAGLVAVARPEDAEIIVINTCGFIGEAKKESIETIFEMAALKESGACKRLIVAGCLSQRHPDELAAEMPEVDHFLGSSDMLGLRAVLSGKADRMLVGDPANWLIQSSDPRRLTTGKASAYVKIAEGCNRSCSFCVIPQLRGKQRSRSADDIVREVEGLAAGGVFEINLISQDTVAYGRDIGAEERTSLAEVVRRVAEVAGVRWVRLFYLYPETIDDALVELLHAHPRVLPYVDMPLQHAADGMLRRMRRGHGGERLRRLVERLRRDISDLTFRTAFIVGHPGETQEEFRELLDFVKWAEFDRVAAFRYSDEEGSPSKSLADKVPTKVAAARYRKLMALQRPIAHAKNQSLVGKTLEVLVEGTSDEHEYVLMGRHAGQAPEIDGQVYLSGGEAQPGTMRRVQVAQASDYDLVGELIDEDHSPIRRALESDADAAGAKRRVGLRVVPSSYR
ncbi:MAG TPA: 30S ribosomal protein S12 methylthiotransferase RimO [Polyangiaceae bacterium]|nr:30S ribosomal protein S12 methylthiotransferase RimO [Polyangiaceae bacterium]